MSVSVLELLGRTYIYESDRGEIGDMGKNKSAVALLPPSLRFDLKMPLSFLIPQCTLSAFL